MEGREEEEGEGQQIEQNGKGEASCVEPKVEAAARSVRGEAGRGRARRLYLRTPVPRPRPRPRQRSGHTFSDPACGSPTATSFFPGNRLSTVARGAGAARQSTGGGGRKIQQPDRKYLYMLMHAVVYKE